MTNKKTHHGSCHCGLVKFEVDIDASKPLQATMCNCRICQKLGMRSLSGKPDQLRVVSDESKHTAYGNPYGTRYFCPTCGVYCYGRGHLEELGGDFMTININALDDLDPNLVEIGHFDGRHDNWHAGLRATPWPVFRESATA